MFVAEIDEIAGNLIGGIDVTVGQVPAPVYEARWTVLRKLRKLDVVEFKFGSDVKSKRQPVGYRLKV